MKSNFLNNVDTLAMILVLILGAIVLFMLIAGACYMLKHPIK